MPYEFTPESFNKFSEDIIKAGGDQATVTSLLADMQATFTAGVAKDIANAESLKTVTAENERLRNANMDLFLRVGSQAVSSIKKESVEEPEGDEKPLTTSGYMNDYFARLEANKK